MFWARPIVACAMLCAAAPAGTTAPARDPLAVSDRPRWTTAESAHLLRRAGFGGPPEQVRYLMRLGRDAAVDLLVDYEKIQLNDADYPVESFLERPAFRQFASLEEEHRRQLFQLVRRVGQANAGALQDWWLRRMVVTSRPLEEKMTLFWHGHFTSGMREVQNPQTMYEQNQLLRRHALGNFKTLVKEISRDRAMLAYLDNGKNVKGKPNENYARELMELFTMGIGHYTEQDVKEAARAFTGWTAGEDGFHIRPRLHDDGPKTFLGRTGNFGGDDIIDIIFEQEATARHLARKLWTFFVERDPETELIDALAARIRENNYDLRETMRLILRSDAFYAPRVRAALIKSPVELIVQTARTLDTPLEDLRGANRLMQQMGQELFQPPNVKGWDGGRAWINTSTLFLRYNAVGAFLKGTPDRSDAEYRRFTARLASLGIGANAVTDAPPSPTRRARQLPPLTTRVGEQMEGDDSMAAAIRSLPNEARAWLRQIRLPRQYSAAQPPYDPAPALESYRLTTARSVVEHYAKRLLHVPLPDDRVNALVKGLQGSGFDPKSPAAAPAIRTLLHLIMSTPEYQLN